MKENTLKTLIAAAIAALSAYFRILLAPIIILLVLMLIDYVSGVAWACISRTLSSKIGYKGILKKAGCLLVVACGMAVDWTVGYALNSVGISFKGTCLFGLLVTVWLILNELISILENLSKVGVPMPDFLKSVVKKLKVTVEKEGTSNIKEEQYGDKLCK